MKKPILLFFVHVVCLSASAQTTHLLDWDFREYYSRDNATMQGYITLAQAQTQYFAFGASKLTITNNFISNNIIGDNKTHTGETGSNGTGTDVEFHGNGTVTFRFADPVTNLKFSLYDIDLSQRATINGFSSLLGVTTVVRPTLSTVTGSIITITNPVVNPSYGQSSSAGSANTSSSGTVNIKFNSAVDSVTIAVTGSNPSDDPWWLSDITGDVTGSFPANYNATSQPLTGQPSYTLIVQGNKFYYLNPATGIVKLLFRDNTHTNMNSMAYDPINQYLYYTYALSNNGTTNEQEKKIRRYDFKMDTFGVCIHDITAYGMPTFEEGVESAGASFYDGNLYLGIEAGSVETESIVWRIDLDANNVPNGFSQVYAQPVINGTSSDRLHDWSDFVVYNGTLYDFDGGAAATNPGVNSNFYVQNLLTGDVATYVPNPTTILPGQTSMDWQGNLYDITASSVTKYNGTNGHTGTTYTIRERVGNSFTNLGSGYGDAAEGVRALCDYGDAPASYDPVAGSPAANERDTALRLGLRLDLENVSRGQTAQANSDNYDDGVGTVPLLTPGANSYGLTVVARNNTGITADAKIIGWLDFNNNGVFDASEASTVATIATSNSFQSITLNWSSFPGGMAASLKNGMFTYLRVRISSAASGISTNTPTGWLNDGETEDYRVAVSGTILPIHLISFDIRSRENDSVEVLWKEDEEYSNITYTVQRSMDSDIWNDLGYIKSTGNDGIKSYSFEDRRPMTGTAHYRLRISTADGSIKYSEIRSIKIGGILAEYVTITPNPASEVAMLHVNNTAHGTRASVRIVDIQGSVLELFRVDFEPGTNLVNLPLRSNWSSGTYFVELFTEAEVISKELLIRR